jgi:hypothetical protein
MYPHERSLVKRLADEPFAIIGVNSDKDHEGVIRYKGHGEEEAKFDARIDALVEAARKARAR